MNPTEASLSTAVVLLPLAYLLVTVCYGLSFFAGNERAARWATPALRIVLGLHLLDLTVLGWHFGQFPAATVSQGLSVISCAVAIVYALVEWRSGERTTGFWLVGVAFLLQLLSSILLQSGDVPERAIFGHPIFAAHASLALLAYVAFVVAAAYGFLFLELYRELKTARFAVFYGKLPPLEVLERMTAGALQIGLVALLVATAIGIALPYQLQGREAFLDPIVVLTFITCVFYGLALALRWRGKLQARHTAIVSLVGLTVVLISLVAVNFLSGRFHGFS